MKAALAHCRTVRITEHRDGVVLSVFMPTHCEDHATHLAKLAGELFRGKKVLVTLVSPNMDMQPLGIKTGKYSPPIPVLREVVKE